MDFDFPIEVDAIDAVPEAVRGLYTEKDGKYTLTDSLKKKLDNTALSQAYQREKSEARKLKDTVKAFEALGKSPDEIAEILKVIDEKNSTELEKKGEWDKMKQQMLENHTKELTTLKDSNKSLQQTLERHLTEAEAVRQIAEQKGNPTILLPHVKAATRVVLEDGDYQVRVVDEKGNPRVDGQGNYLTIKDLVAEMKSSTVYGCAFASSGASGSGASGDGQQDKGKGSGNTNRSKMTQAEKSAFIAEHGLDSFQKLPW